MHDILYKTSQVHSELFWNQKLWFYILLSSDVYLETRRIPASLLALYSVIENITNELCKICSALVWCQLAFPDSPKDLSIYGVWNTSSPQFWHTIPTEVIVYRNYSSGIFYFYFYSGSSFLWSRIYLPLTSEHGIKTNTINILEI